MALSGSGRVEINKAVPLQTNISHALEQTGSPPTGNRLGASQHGVAQRRGKGIRFVSSPCRRTIGVRVLLLKFTEYDPARNALQLQLHSAHSWAQKSRHRYSKHRDNQKQTS